MNTVCDLSAGIVELTEEAMDLLSGGQCGGCGYGCCNTSCHQNCTLDFNVNRNDGFARGASTLGFSSFSHDSERK